MFVVNNLGKLPSLTVPQGESLGHCSELSLDDLQLVGPTPLLYPSVSLTLSFSVYVLILNPELCAW